MLLDYLKKLFGEEHIKESKLNLKGLPFYLLNEYKFCCISIFSKMYVFAVSKKDLNLKSYKVQKRKLEDIISIPVVLCIDKLIFQQRDNLINSGIEFIEPGRQIFMPSLGIVLDNRRNSVNTKPVEKFTPQIQLCALFFLYKPKKEYTTKEIATTTNLNIMAVSRGVSALVKLDLLLVRTDVRTNYYTIKVDKHTFLASVKDYLISPVLKSVYAVKETIGNLGLKSGYTALSQLTSIVDGFVHTYAISKKEYKTVENDCIESEDLIFKNDGIVKIEIWKYDPCIFMVDGCVDKLSLVLSFAKDNDERTEEALKEIIREIGND